MFTPRIRVEPLISRSDGLNQQIKTPLEELVQLRRLLVGHFSDGELHTLCFDLGVDMVMIILNCSKVHCTNAVWDNANDSIGGF